MVPDQYFTYGFSGLKQMTFVFQRRKKKEKEKKNLSYRFVNKMIVN